jgi:signal transduction histidine kinase
MGGMTDMTAPGHLRGATGGTTESDRRDEQIRWALQYDQDQADGTIDSERRDARDVQERTDTQRRDARDEQYQAETDQVRDRRDARDAQDLIDVQAATQRRDARHAQDLVDDQAAAQRRDARHAQDLVDDQAAAQRRDARDSQDLVDDETAAQRRDAREDQADDETAAQRRDPRDNRDPAEAEQDSDRREAQDLVDDGAAGQRRDARDAQDRIDVQADTQRRDARDNQDLIDVQAATQRRDARDAQDLIDDQAAAQRRAARDNQDQADDETDTQRRAARDNQDQAETEQDSDRRDAQDLFDARRHGERHEAFEQSVTDHQRADELERTILNLEAFSYTVSHDLRAPLRAMSGYSEALVEEYGPSLGEVGRGYAERIQSASQQMAELIEAVLRLTRISKAEIRCQAVDLGAEASGIAAELQRGEPDRRVRFTIQRPAWALADPPLIRNVLQNLMQNAWKFTAGQDDPSIEFGMTPDTDAHVRCYVRDNGAGFEPAYTDKLFTPFQRLHKAAQYPGTGIGLASVRQILERHGGDVHAEGAVGHGATFSFTLASASSPA